MKKKETTRLPLKAPWRLFILEGSILDGSGNDPLRKLATELEALKRWELQVPPVPPAPPATKPLSPLKSHETADERWSGRPANT